MQLEFGGRSYPVAAGDFVIGSGTDATLVILAAGVRARHAIIRRLGDGMASVVPAAPDAEILVNGARLGNDPTPLMHGDKIRIGGQEITVVDPRRGGATQVAAAPSDRPTVPQSARLVSLADGREYSIKAPFILGREAVSSVVVEGDAVSRRHAEIRPTPEGEELVDLSSNGTFVNGARVSGATRLKAGDVIRIGNQEFRYHPGERAAPVKTPEGAEFKLGGTLLGMPAMKRPAPPMPVPAPAPAPAEPALASILVKSGGLSGTRLEVRSAVANIGRADFNDLRLPDASVSANHAKLQLREGVWVLTDLGSTNGTKVGGERVQGEAPLSPGVEIVLGDVRLFFEPKDTGVKRPAGTAVMEKPQPAAAPKAAARPPAPKPGRRIAIVVAILLAALLLMGYYFFV